MTELATSFTCPECEKSFKSPTGLRRHKAAVHGQGTTYQCGRDGCTKIVASASALYQHWDVVHDKLKPYRCEYEGCGKGFAVLNDLHRHTSAVHRKERPFVCEECGQCLSRKQNLVQHVAIVHHHRKIFKCRYCDDTFSYSRTRTKHEEKSHASEIAEKKDRDAEARCQQLNSDQNNAVQSGDQINKQQIGSQEGQACDQSGGSGGDLSVDPNFTALMPYIVGVWHLCQLTGCHPSDLFPPLQTVSETEMETTDDSVKRIPSRDTFIFRPTRQCRYLYQLES